MFNYQFVKKEGVPPFATKFNPRHFELVEEGLPAQSLKNRVFQKSLAFFYLKAHNCKVVVCFYLKERTIHKKTVINWAEQSCFTTTCEERQDSHHSHVKQI